MWRKLTNNQSQGIKSLEFMLTFSHSQAEVSLTERSQEGQRVQVTLNCAAASPGCPRYKTCCLRRAVDMMRETTDGKLIGIRKEPYVVLLLRLQV
jgi:hypothetical protein